MEIDQDSLAAAAALFDVDQNSLQFKGGSDGAVYTCRRGSRACALKFVPLTLDRRGAYEEKLAFVLYLAGNGVPVAAPLEARSGRRYEILPGPQGLYGITLTEMAYGRHPTPRNPYDWNERLFVCWGQVMGKMHALARAYPSWQTSPPGCEGPPSQIADWQSERDTFARMCAEPQIAAQWLRLCEPLAALPRERDSFGLIHNDLHMWNFLYNPDARSAHPITIIDFDVCAYHWFIADIAIAAYHGLVYGPRKSLDQRETFVHQFLPSYLRGYRQENELDPGWLDHLPLFLRYCEALSYIALSTDWPEETRSNWQAAFLAVKRARILSGEALIGMDAARGL